MSRRDVAWLNVATAIADANEYRWKHGCVVTRGGNVLSVGQSKRRNDPRSVDPSHLNKCSVHAEADALSRVSNTHGTVVYVARTNKRGERRNSKPCVNCELFMQTCGVRKVVYT